MVASPSCAAQALCSWRSSDSRSTSAVVTISGARPSVTTPLGDHHAGDVAPRGHLEHDRLQGLLEDRAQPAGAGAALDRALGDGLQGAALEVELDAIELEHLLVLLDQGVLGLGEDLDEGLAGRGSPRS
jgi:hypothetical protein